MADPTVIPRKLWEHPNPKGTLMWKFMQTANQTRGLSLQTFQDLYQWSITDRPAFWADYWKLANYVHEGTYTRVVDTEARMDSLPRWFEGVRLNFAENILYTASPSDPSVRSTRHKEDSKIAATEVREGVSSTKHVSWAALRAKVGLLSNALRAQGLKKGDRVAAVASNSTETLACFLATTALGGIFSSAGTDMGTKGVLDRFVQISPKFIFVDDAAVYNGKTVDLRPKIEEIVEGLKGDGEFVTVVTQPRFEEAVDISGLSKTTTLEKFLEAAKGDEAIRFERVEFRDPFLIVYSSGTTGIPKSIVHSVGGVLLGTGKENILHRELDPNSVCLQFSNTGWIMYLASVCALVPGTRAIYYDGSPFQPDLTTFVRLIGEQKVTHLGISPRYMQTLQQGGIRPREVTDLSSLQSVTSTGMVLSDALFEWFYDEGFPSHVHLANVSGGTDLASCFGIENPLTPVYVGGTQGGSLGTAVAVYDQLVEGGKGVTGKELPDGQAGELVGVKGFPSQPIFFWGDKTGEKYFNAYYARFDNVWTHGDFIMKHPLTNQIFFLGRADGVLNPSGVRFGSAEIYSVLESHFAAQIADSICVGQRRPSDSDESVMLFLLMQPGQAFTAQLVAEVRRVIGKECSKRHVPTYVFETKEIPTTVNLKKVELPVKQIVSGVRVKPSGTLLNPGCLEFYYRFTEDEVLREGLAPVKSRL